MGIKEIKCMKCGNTENVFVEVEKKQNGTFSVENTFLCRSCNLLSTIDSVKQKLVCKHCKSSNITKLFSVNKVMCPKCGQFRYSEIHKVKLE